MPSHLLRSGPVALAPTYLGPSPPHNHHSKRAPRAAPRTALPLAGRSSPPQSNPPRLPHRSQTPRPTCSRGPVRPGWTEGDQALSHPPPLGGALPAAALSVRAATGGAGARGCRRLIRGWHQAVPPPSWASSHDPRCPSVGALSCQLEGGVADVCTTRPRRL